MKRPALALIGAVLLVAVSVPGVAAARPVEPKVVLVVGPAGGATDDYRALADKAAAAAAKYTRNVVRVYSPNATWPAVRRALEGASIVVYLGHGNGFPSRYRSSLYPASQNGFGLNPVGGVDDSSHQYFGEAALVDSGVRLATNAVVLLHHLCYASGNTEPGLPEGTLADAQQRVDNYAAGFLRIGARAVVAEGHMGPAWYVGQLLSSKRTVERIWKSSPKFNGNLLRFDSVRTPGFAAHMDPEREDSGFYRSLVVRPGLRADQVRGGATRARPGDAELPVLEPSLAGLGIEFAAPSLADAPTAGSQTKLAVPVSLPEDEVLPSKVMLGVRWDPIEVAAAEPDPPPPLEPADPSASPDPDGTPATELVQPEVAGAVVAAAPARREKGRLVVPIDVPASPGLYRLVTTLHDGSGVAFDAATQDLLPALLVRVTGPLAARYEAPAAVAAAPGAELDLEVAITNIGTSGWGVPTAIDPRRLGGRVESVGATNLVARWIGLAGEQLPSPGAQVALELDVSSGETVEASLGLATPLELGEYLVLLDVVTPEHGSLAAAGVEPAIVRVSIVPADQLPTPSPAAGPRG